jgi:SAM-dependent methyltransferase
MHKSSFDKMLTFRNTYLAHRQDQDLMIMDLGSQDVNGSYKPCFEQENWTYVGVDMAPGKNVDIVLKDPYQWKEVKSASVDVLVSGQAFEHIEYFWVTMQEVARVLKPGGLVCIIAPSGGFEHKYPVDCWRFYPDGFRALARYAGLAVVDSFAQWEDDPVYGDDSNFWHDCVLIAQKNREPFFKEIKRRLGYYLTGLLGPIERG